MLRELRAQLQEECSKRQQVQQQLLAEQRHFAGQLQQIQGMTKGVTSFALICTVYVLACRVLPCKMAKTVALLTQNICDQILMLNMTVREDTAFCAAGEPAASPGGAVHGLVVRLQKQLDAVIDGQDITAVQHRSMRTPHTTGALHSTPRTSSLPTASTVRPGTSSTSRTPLSVKSNVLDEENAAYWHKRSVPTVQVCMCDQPLGLSAMLHIHMLVDSAADIDSVVLCRYEEQAIKLAALESSHRRLSLQAGMQTTRSARRASFGFASPSVADLTPKLAMGADSRPAHSPILSMRGASVDIAPPSGLQGQENTPTLAAGNRTDAGDQ
jgi:hypothetical protein